MVRNSAIGVKKKALQIKLYHLLQLFKISFVEAAMYFDRNKLLTNMNSNQDYTQTYYELLCSGLLYNSSWFYN